MGQRLSFGGRVAFAALCLALLSACATPPSIVVKPVSSDRLQGMSCEALLIRLKTLELQQLQQPQGNVKKQRNVQHGSWSRWWRERERERLGEIIAIDEYAVVHCGA